MRQWLVELDGESEQIAADDVEITASGALVFYRFASRTEPERAVMTAFSASLWRRCQLENTD